MHIVIRVPISGRDELSTGNTFPSQFPIRLTKSLKSSCDLYWTDHLNWVFVSSPTRHTFNRCSESDRAQIVV